MNKDQVEGKMKDVGGRVERQVGEWTGDKEAQVKGAMKQAEGKAQNAWGDAKDSAKKSADNAEAQRKESEKHDQPVIEEETETHTTRRKAS